MVNPLNSVTHWFAFPTLAVIGLSVAASAQGFNVDFDIPTGGTTCSSTYAAAGTAGTWNSANGLAASVYSLLDKSGAASNVTMTLSSTLTAGLFNANVVYTGGDAALMQDINYGSGPETIHFTGLVNGDYDVYTYAQAPDNKTGFVTGVDCPQSTGGLQNVGGLPWGGSHQQGVSYAKHSATVTNGILHLDITVVTSFISLNGVQIEPSGPGNIGNAYCFGDGTGASCPCSAFGALGAGCANTSGAGAVLTGSGNASFGIDAFQLDITGVPGDKPGLVLKGDSQVAIPAGDGILCSTGASLRSHVQVTSMGATTFTDFNGSPFGSVSNAGGVPTNFQFWYRDPTNMCSGAGFNFTNGWTVTYLP